MESDPGYQALRLRGLAGLLRAGEHGLEELANLPEVVFFLATTLDDIAAALVAEGHHAAKPPSTLHAIRPDSGS